MSVRGRVLYHGREAIMSDAQEVVVLETADPTELRLARNLFEQEGIPCRVDGGGTSAILGSLLGSQIGGLQTLLVPAECEERALEILQAAWPEEETDESE